MQQRLKLKRDGYIAAGIIQYSLYRTKNVYHQAFAISRQHRERLNGHKGKVIYAIGFELRKQHQEKNAVENIGRVSKIALNLQQSAKKKLKEMSIHRLRKKAGWDDTTLLILQANF